METAEAPLATWGRKAGCPLLDDLALTSRQMTDSLAASYRNAGAEIGAKIAHVGLAFGELGETHPELELYDPDLSHPAPAEAHWPLWFC